MREFSYSVINKFKIITALCCILFFSFSIHAETIYELDFTSATGDVKEWFYNKNWVFHEDIKDMNFGFSVGDNMASTVGDLLWFGPLKRLQKLMFHTPLVYGFVAGSFVYHDYIWYPNHGKKRYNKWLNTTHWGRLFDSY